MKRHDRGVPRKSRPHAVYLKPGIPEDDLLRAIWEAGKDNGRRIQDMFRTLLLEGLRRQLELGTFPKAFMEHPAIVEELARNPEFAEIAAGRRTSSPPRHVVPPASAASIPAPLPPAPVAEPIEPAPVTERPAPKGLSADLM